METFPEAKAVVEFWRNAGPDRWFKRDEIFDAACTERFRTAWEAARTGALDHWAATPEGALALVLLLDQMPRNMFRGDPLTYATDDKACAIADAAIARGFDTQVPAELRRFFALPFMHSETLAGQDRSVALAQANGDPDVLKWARHHRDIVARFGRFPHRNALLGRESTPDEREWMAQEDAFKG
jgi:uncharacterized protein (DUF924 family)